MPKHEFGHRTWSAYVAMEYFDSALLNRLAARQRDGLANGQHLGLPTGHLKLKNGERESGGER